MPVKILFELALASVDNSTGTTSSLSVCSMTLATLHTPNGE
jgi:hypothetical protein